LQGGRREQSQIGYGDGPFLVAHSAGGGGRESHTPMLPPPLPQVFNRL
jgi:hypothetical protein